MTALPTRILARRLAALTCSAALFACGDDDGTGPEPFSLTELANQLSRIQSGVIVQDATQASANDLRESIGFIMTNQGFPSESPPPTGLATRVGQSAHGRILDAMAPPEPVDLFAAMGASAPPRPPLNSTCDWNVSPEVNFWKLDRDNRLGPPPSDGVRFELYATQPQNPDRPIIPLQPVGSYLDVRPVSQGTQVLDVIVTAGPANTQDVLFNYELEGTSTPDVVNLFMSGIISNAAGALDFFFTLDAVRGTAGGTIEDLLLENSIGVDFANQANTILTVEKSNNATLEYDFDFDATTRVITRGEVRLDGVPVALITGTQSAPVFAVIGNSLSAQARSELTSILLNADAISGRITDFFLFAHCVGSERPEECQRL